MKNLLFILALLTGASSLRAQIIQNLYGAHPNAGSAKFSKINVVNTSYTQVSTLSGTFSTPQGETTFDDKNFRYFINTSDGILVIDALTGVALDTITTVPWMRSMEYDAREDRLVGMRWDGTAEKFCQVDVAFHTYSDISVLPGVGSLTQGESTFDEKNRRYFARTNLGIIAVDSNGVVIDTVASPMQFSGIEYEPINDRLFGVFWNGNNWFFSYIDIAFDNFVQMAAIDGVGGMVQGISTMDKLQGHYFMQSASDILMADAIAGTLIKKIPNTNNFGNIEYKNVVDPNSSGVKKENSQNNSITVFPNPAIGQFNIEGLHAGDRLRIFNLFGQLILEKSILELREPFDLGNAPAGLYLLVVEKSKGLQLVEKLLLEK